MNEYAHLDFNSRLLKPKGRLAELLRDLAEAAMSVTHHDASEHEPGYQHEVQAMERKFRPLIRRYMRGLS